MLGEGEREGEGGRRKDEYGVRTGKDEKRGGRGRVLAGGLARWMVFAL